MFLCLKLMIIPLETILVNGWLGETLTRHHLLGLGVVHRYHRDHGAAAQYLRDLIVFCAEMHNFLEFSLLTVFTSLIKVESIPVGNYSQKVGAQ